MIAHGAAPVNCTVSVLSGRLTSIQLLATLHRLVPSLPVQIAPSATFAPVSVLIVVSVGAVLVLRLKLVLVVYATVAATVPVLS